MELGLGLELGIGLELGLGLGLGRRARARARARASASASASAPAYRVAPLAKHLGLELGQPGADALVESLDVLGLVGLLHGLQDHL